MRKHGLRNRPDLGPTEPVALRPHMRNLLMAVDEGDDEAWDANDIDMNVGRSLVQRGQPAVRSSDMPGTSRATFVQDPLPSVYANDPEGRRQTDTRKPEMNVFLDYTNMADSIVRESGHRYFTSQALMTIDPASNVLAQDVAHLKASQDFTRGPGRGFR